METILRKVGKKTLATVVVASFFVFLGSWLPIISHAQAQGEDTYHKAQVLSVFGEEAKEEYGQSTITQQVKVRVVSGALTGKEVTVPFEMDATRAKDQRLQKGDYVVVGRSVQIPEPMYYISDLYRLNALWVLLAVFAVITLLTAGIKGARAFLGLGISFLVIGLFIVPFIIKGHSPFMVSLIGVVIIASVGLYSAHGFQKRTHVAFASTALSIGVAFVFTVIAVKMTKLFGLGTEEAFLLQSVPSATYDLRGLLLGGIILGTLGVLDDVTTAQAAAVEEIYNANKTFGVKELYKRASSVGKEHITSLINTLALAYTGASFPLLLLFYIYERPLWVTLNSELILEEVVRTLVGSGALVIAVPLTTIIAAMYFSRQRT